MEERGAANPLVNLNGNRHRGRSERPRDAERVGNRRRHRPRAWSVVPPSDTQRPAVRNPRPVRPVHPQGARRRGAHRPEARVTLCGVPGADAPAAVPPPRPLAARPAAPR